MKLGVVIKDDSDHAPVDAWHKSSFFFDVEHVITLAESINWELALVEESLANLYSQQRQLINWELELIARIETHNLLCQHICNPAFPNNEHWQLEREVWQYQATKAEVDKAIKEAHREIARIQQ